MVMFKKLWRWLFWSLTICFLLAIVTAIGIRFYARTEHFAAVLRTQIISTVNESLNGELQFQKVSGSLWHGLSFHEISVTQGENVIVSAPVVSVQFGFLEQIYAFFSSSRIRIGKLTITNPKLTLVRDKEHNWNILKLIKSEPMHPSGALSVILPKITIENGTIDMRTAEGHEGRFSSLMAAGRFDFLPKGIESNIDNLTLQLDSPGLPRTALDASLSLTARDETSSVAVKRLTISTAESRLMVTGTVTDLSDPTVNLDLHLKKGSAKELIRFLPTLPLREDLVASLRASGTLSSLTLSGSMGAPDGRIVGSIAGNWNTSEPQLRGKLAFHDFVFDKVLSLPRLKGKINGQVDFQGSSLETVQLSTRSKISALTVNEWKVGDVTGAGRLKNKRFDFTAELDGTMGDTEVQGNIGWSSMPRYEVTLRARSLDIRRALGGLNDLPKTRLNADAWIRGSGTELDTLQADIKMTLYSSQIRDIEINEGRADGSLRDGALVVRRARIAANGATLQANGTIGSVTRPSSGNFNYDFTFNNIKPWLKLRGLDGSGKAKITGTLGGSLTAPRLTGTASVKKFQFGANRIENGTAQWTIDRSASKRWQGKLDFTATELKAGIPLQSAEAQFTLDGIDPAKVTAGIVVRDSNKQVHRLKGRILYSPANAEITLEEVNLQLPTGMWRNPEPIRLLMAEQTLHVNNFLLAQGKQSLTVQGSIGLQGKQDLFFRVNHLPLSDLRPYVKDTPNVTGTLFLAMRVTGTPDRPLIDTTMSVEQLTLAGQPYYGLTVKAFYQKERAAIDLELQQDNIHRLNITGIIPVYIGWDRGRSPTFLGESSFRIHSEGLSPAFLNLATKDLDKLKGSLSVDINLRGPVDALAANGTIQFREGAVVVRPLGLSLTGIDLQARLTPVDIKITHAAIASGEGQLTGSGRLAYSDFTLGAISLALKLDELQVINTREYKAKASGKLLVAGSWQKPTIRGSVGLKGTLRPDLTFFESNGRAAQDTTITVVKNERDLTSPQPQAKGPTSTQGGKSTERPRRETDFYRRLGFDLTTAISRDTWLYLDSGFVELTGQLRVKKEPQEKLNLAGEVNGIRGSYTFKGRRFQMEKARVNFTGGDEIDPSLDIVGRHRVPQYLIEVVVGGYASKPTLTLRSDPPLDQADVLSVLLFGKPTNALSEGEQINLQGQAALITADFFAADLKGSIAEQLGLDTLDISVGNDVSAGQIGVGKYITDDVFLSTKQQIGDEYDQEYSIEYNITPDWQIKSSTNPEGKSSIDLFWRKRY